MTDRLGKPGASSEQTSAYTLVFIATILRLANARSVGTEAYLRFKATDSRGSDSQRHLTLGVLGGFGSPLRGQSTGTGQVNWED